MDSTSFIADLEQHLELQPGALTLDSRLDQMAEWDSLAIVGFLAMCDTKYGIRVSPALLKGCKTPADLFEQVKAG